MNEEMLRILKEVQEDTKKVTLLVHDMEELKQFKTNSRDMIIDTVRNNSDLADEFSNRALIKVKAYLDSNQARDNLEVRVKDTIDKQMLKVLLKWLAIQGSILMVVFGGLITWIIK